jgi:hypothetical protein
MLRKFIYKIISLFLLIPFLAASTGLSIYFHKCSCEQRLIATLFVEHKCHEEQVSSCCSTINKNVIKFSDADASCGCKTEHLTFKVTDLFNDTNPTVLSEKFVFLKVTPSTNENISINIYSQGFIADNNHYIPDDSPPIKPAGRILINLLHQSKTPESLS